MGDDIREHPDYEAGYKAAWYGRPAKTGTPAYLAGHEAGMRARHIFEEAGFGRGAGGLYTKKMQIKGEP